MRYIDADKLMITLNDWWYSQTKIESQNIPYDDDISVTIQEAMEAVKEQPTADVRENVKGEWRRRKDTIQCSQCKAKWIDHTYLIETFRFCPNCGADMRGES